MTNWYWVETTRGEGGLPESRSDGRYSFLGKKYNPDANPLSDIVYDHRGRFADHTISKIRTEFRRTPAIGRTCTEERREKIWRD